MAFEVKVVAGVRQTRREDIEERSIEKVASDVAAVYNAVVSDGGRIVACHTVHAEQDADMNGMRYGQPGRDRAYTGRGWLLFVAEMPGQEAPVELTKPASALEA